jgi:hypothetical protein
MKRLFLIMLSCGILLGFGSWGFLMHRTVHQMAIYELPKPMQPFFYKNMDYMVKHSIRPDERRNSDPTEATKHFIDFEAYGDSAAWKMPYKWEAAVAKYSQDTLLKYGHVPYVIMQLKERLTNAFRQQNRDSILFYAADIGHYIGDAHVPLHTTLNYDGQLTGQKGLHSLWESMVPEIELSNYNLSSHHKAKYLKNPEGRIWESLRSTFKMVDDVLRFEREVSKGFTDSTKYRVQIRRGREVKSYSTAFAKAYAEKINRAVNEQAVRSADMLADFLYTAWVDGGKPNMITIMNNSMTKDDKKSLKQEIKWFKRNQLLENKKLLSRQGGSNED